MAESPKTLAEHTEYLREIVRLKLWFLFRWLREHPGEEFTPALRQRVDIYRKTDANPVGLCPKEDFEQPAWRQLETGLGAVYAKHRGSGSAEAFEAEAFAVVEAAVQRRAPLDLQKERERDQLKAYQCGSLRYDKPSPDQPRTVFFHIANAVAPRSIFDEPAYLPGCLLDLMNRAEAEFGADALQTDTWLNSLPRWLEFFPASWQANLGPANHDVQWHYGFWGQFINARGTLNRKLADRLRQTGELPFWPRRSRCSFAELRSHLRDRT